MAPSFDYLWLLPYSVFLAGFIGSPHCISMCGPLIVNFAKSRGQMLCYQLGRLLSYASVGMLAGYFGNSIFRNERPLWLSYFGLFAIAGLLFFNAYRTFFNRPQHFILPSAFNLQIQKAWRLIKFEGRSKNLTSFLAGCLTVLLPCAHLYGFLIGALATNSAIGGGIYMLAFWLGSTPPLVLGGALISRFFNFQFRNAQRLAGALLIVSGILSILAFGTRAQMFSKQTLQSGTKSQMNCH